MWGKRIKMIGFSLLKVLKWKVECSGWTKEDMGWGHEETMDSKKIHIHRQVAHKYLYVLPSCHLVTKVETCRHRTCLSKWWGYIQTSFHTPTHHSQTNKTNLLLQQFFEFPLTVPHTVYISTVHHPDEAISALKVVPPVGPEGALTTNVPDVQLIPVEDSDSVCTCWGHRGNWTDWNVQNTVPHGFPGDQW